MQFIILSEVAWGLSMDNNFHISYRYSIGFQSGLWLSLDPDGQDLL